MLNSERFLSAFNKIDHRLRQITKQGKEMPFSTLVAQAINCDSAVRRYANDLREYADLRNAIVHERTNSHVIAEPNDKAVEHMEYIASLVTDPPKVISLSQKEVCHLDKDASVADAVKVMLDKSFSQIPIYDDQGFVALLATDTIARWLGACLEEDIFSLKENNIDQVLKFSERQERSNYSFLRGDANIFEALQKFDEYQENGQKLDAILITQNGKPAETLLGIINLWDLPKIYSIIQEQGV